MRLCQAEPSLGPGTHMLYWCCKRLSSVSSIRRCCALTGARLGCGAYSKWFDNNMHVRIHHDQAQVLMLC